MNKQTFITDEKILKFIKEMNGEIGRRKLSEVLNISERRARKMLSKYSEIHEKVKLSSVTDKDVAEYLKGRGLSVESVINILTPQKYSQRIIGDKYVKEFPIGIIGDTHLCDKACAMDELYDYYDKCKKAGVEHVVHAGDLTAGINVYKGMEYDLSVHGFADQLKYIEQYYPKIEGITTHVISGNHDLSFKQSAGANIVEEVSNRRNDIKWIGDYDATMLINGVSIGLHHGAGGSAAYSVSYRLQKYIEKIGAGQKPSIYVLGHYHTALAMFYRNIHCFLPGCWQKPNDFSVRLGLPNMICGYISNIKVEDDEHRSIRSMSNEIITYYS